MRRDGVCLCLFAEFFFGPGGGGGEGVFDAIFK